MFIKALRIFINAELIITQIASETLNTIKYQFIKAYVYNTH